ncbi:MAG: hypothetical protein QMD46_07325 [Methanomicrobiales archaeon]|nr:hypothetical protein [Methanomicrobiales archaeon]MDI6876440.1 hypothetical protein [Methanomicrobiales archaeon]
MKPDIVIEIVGFQSATCGPFPCDESRTCELSDCHPDGTLIDACKALESCMRGAYGDRVQVKFTNLDEGVPDAVREIIEKHHPPLPIVMVNGRLTPIGRISWPLIQKEVEKRLTRG